MIQSRLYDCTTVETVAQRPAETRGQTDGCIVETVRLEKRILLAMSCQPAFRFEHFLELDAVDTCHLLNRAHCLFLDILRDGINLRQRRLF